MRAKKDGDRSEEKRAMDSDGSRWQGGIYSIEVGISKLLKEGVSFFRSKLLILWTKDEIVGHVIDVSD